MGKTQKRVRKSKKRNLNKITRKFKKMSNKHLQKKSKKYIKKRGRKNTYNNKVGGVGSVARAASGIARAARSSANAARSSASRAALGSAAPRLGSAVPRAPLGSVNTALFRATSRYAHPTGVVIQNSTFTTIKSLAESIVSEIPKNKAYKIVIELVGKDFEKQMADKTIDWATGWLNRTDKTNFITHLQNQLQAKIRGKVVKEIKFYIKDKINSPEREENENYKIIKTIIIRDIRDIRDGRFNIEEENKENEENEVFINVDFSKIIEGIGEEEEEQEEEQEEGEGEGEGQIPPLLDPEELWHELHGNKSKA